MSRHVFSGVITVITVLVLFTPAPLPGAEKGDAILETIPAESIFCVRVNNLNQTTTVLDQYLMGIAPVMTTGLIKGQLGMMFGNPELKGFDLAGSFAVFATAEPYADMKPDSPRKAKSYMEITTGDPGPIIPSLYFLLPVTDYNQIIDPNFRVTAPDGNGISTVGTGPAGQFFIKQVRSFALMSKDYGKLGNMADSISSGKSTGLSTTLYTAQVMQATSEPIWAYANVVKISDVYKKQISDGIEEMKKQAANPGAGIQQKIDNLERAKIQMAAVDPNNPAIGSFNAEIESLKARKQQLQTHKTPAAMAGIMDAFGTTLKDFMQQTRSVTLVCNPRPDVLNFRANINALTGTKMAEMLVADVEHPAKNDLAGFAEDGAAMNFVAWINHTLMKKGNIVAVDLMAQMAGKDVNDPNIVKTKKLCDDYTDSIGDFIVCSFKIDPNAKPFFDAKYVLEVKDVNRFNEVTNEFVQTWTGSAFNDLYKNMGMETGFTVKRGAENYKGVSIDVAKLSMKFTDSNSPEAKAIEAIYGSGFEYRWAIVNGLWVCRISSDPNAIYKLIDQVKAGPPSQVCSEMQKAMSIIPDAGSKDAIVTYNYLRLMKVMQAFAPMPFTMPDIPSKSNLVFAAKVGNGSLAVDFALSKEHLSEMMMAFQMIMQMQMQKQMQQTSPGMQMQPISQ